MPTKMPCSYKKKNPELGFIPLALAAAPVAGKLVGGVGKALGGLFKKKKKKAPAPAPAAGSKKPAATSASRAGSPKVGHKKSKKPTTIVATSDKPSLTKADLAKALQDYHQARQTTKQAHAQLTARVKSTLGPQIAAISKMAKQADIRAQVTSEHNRRMKEAALWDDSKAAHAKILSKINDLEKALVADRVKKNRAFDIYGVHA